MVRSTDQRGSGGTGTGGAPPPPPDLDLIAADEGPMRGDLKRQIQALEGELAQFIVDNCPYEVLPTVDERGPTVLTTEQLEFVRDELLVLQRELYERVVAQASGDLDVEEPRPEVVGLFERLRRRLRELRA
jgi:hypothetical protein